MKWDDLCSLQCIYPERFGSAGASGSQSVPRFKLNFDFDIRRPSDRRSYIEPLPQLEWRTRIFLAVWINALQGENACAGHPMETSTGEHQESDADTVAFETFLCRKGHVVMVRKRSGSLYESCRVNFCVCLHGYGTGRGKTSLVKSGLWTGSEELLTWL